MNRAEVESYFQGLYAMTTDEAVEHLRKVAASPGAIPRTGRAAELVLAELDRVRAALDLEVSLRTLGGTPPAVDPNWANVTSVPPSAHDDRMPAHRRVGLARSTDSRGSV